MGEVCLADDLVLHRQVALKFLASADDRSHDDILEQLLTEARAAAALDHPFICAIYEVTALDGRPCIAMEYVRGETLERRLRRGPLTIADALRVAEEIAEALEAAHRRRVIHRDLKPANVMLTEDQHVKVMDFGLATRLPMEIVGPDPRANQGGPTPSPSQRTTAHTGVVRGTPAYMAPEQIRGADVDRRSDIFAFGILCYELLSGVNPFHRGRIDTTLAAILGEPAPDLRERVAGIPAPLATLVGRMLAQDPQARPQSFGDVRATLRRATADVVPSAASSRTAVVVDPPRADRSARLIGRDVERAQLVDAVRQAVARRGGLVILEGEAGIGKTRLADEALHAARQLGCVTLVGRCYEQEGAPPLVPFIEVLEDASRLLPASTFRRVVAPGASELVKLLPELQRLFPAMEAPLELPPQLQQRFLFRNIEDFLARCTEVAPLVVFLDDLQWADEPTLHFTQYLAPRLANAPILVIAACRDAEAPRAAASKGTLQQWLGRVRSQGREASSPTVRSIVEDLVRERAARVLALRPFGEAEVRGLLAALAHDEPPASLVRQFVAHTGGNAFFVAELYRHLSDERRLFDASGRWRRELDLDEVEIPESVRGVLARRVERVSPNARNVLRAAAIIGRQFDLDLLEAVADMEGDALLRGLEEAEGARLLKGPSGRRDVLWRFPHQLICQTLVAAIPQPRRQRLHLRTADAMARLDPDGQTYAADVAHHLYNAGRLADPERTARALVAAGDAACEVYATDEAIRHYRRALEVLDASVSGAGVQPAHEAMRRGVDERLADLLALVGDRAAALERYDSLATMPGRAEDRVAQARIARKVGTLHWQGGDRERAMACYRRALDTLDGSADALEAAHLYQELGRAAFRSGDNAEAVRWAERALEAAEMALAGESAIATEVRRTATAAVAHATNTIGVALARSGELDAAPTHRTQRDHRARARPARCRLPRLRQSRRALQHDRTAARHRGIADGPRARVEDWRGVAAVVHLRQPGGRVLRADRSVRARRIRGRGGGGQPRSGARAARPSRRPAHRDGADSSVPGRAAARAGRLSRSAGARGADRRAAAHPAVLRRPRDRLPGPRRSRPRGRIHGAGAAAL